MQTFKCIVENPMGMHARPAALIAQLCVGIKSIVTFKCNNRIANGNNVLQLLGLGAKKGDLIEITVEGENETEDLQKIRDEVLDCTPEDIRKTAEYIREMMSDNKLVVVGNEKLIRENEKLFGKVENLL